MSVALADLTDTQRLALRLQLPENRIYAHQVLFKHRHPDATPPFHEDIIRLWHSSTPSIIIMAFREGGKSTIAEEAIALGATFKLFNNCIILGSNEARAFDRLRAIKHEIETNELIRGLYGDLKGVVWNEGRIVLANGTCIQAFGRGQALRGVKHLQYRPDLCLADDIEEEEHVRDPHARHETLRWFMGTVLPALDRHARIRMLATPLDREALPLTLQSQPNWVTRIFPVEYLDPSGARAATWPDRYSLAWVDTKKREMDGVGLAHDYQREYMCVAEDASRKVFTADMIRVEPKVRVWQTTHAFIDPARSVKQSSATTGWAVWSYSGSRITVWDGGASLMLPSDIINHIFDLNERYAPAAIGVEETGLNEFLLQPLRMEMEKRSIFLPLLAMNAPRGKNNFIEALQPKFASGEIVFAQELPVMRAQFLSYPTGRIDAPNALAYAMRMRPGEVVLPAFSEREHVTDYLPVYRGEPFFLAVNASATITVAVLLQVVDGGITIHADFVRDDPPGVALPAILASARARIGAQPASTPDLVAVAPPAHFADYDTVGLRGAARAVPVELSRGAGTAVGIDALRSLLQNRTTKGDPLVRIHFSVRWVLNAFSSGYSYDLDPKTGTPKAEPRANIYRLIGEAVGTVAGLVRAGSPVLSQSLRPNYAFTASGTRYLSAMPNARDDDDLKNP